MIGGILMKVFTTILKIVAALAAIAGIVYVIATYGDKIVAWAKKLLGKAGCCCGEVCQCECEEVPCEDAPCEEAPAQEAEEAPEAAESEEGTVQAEETDFQ